MSSPNQYSIEQRALWLQWQNYAGLAWRQRNAHASNLAILLVAFCTVGFFAFSSQSSAQWAARITAPVWLSGNSVLIGALWLLYISFRLRFRVCSFQAKRTQDWLAALPIPEQARWQFLKLKSFGYFAFELIVGALMMSWLSTWRAALAFIGLGVVIAVLANHLLPNRPYAHVAAATALDPTRAKSASLSRSPMQAWFFASMPSSVQLRWFWLLPLLLLPMAASFGFFFAVIMGFAAYLRMAAISAAISRAFLGMSALLHASPMPANVIYRAGLRFAVQALWPLLIMAGLMAWMLPAQLKLFGASMVLLAGILMMISQHHFSFGFRFLHVPQPGAHSERVASARAWLVFLMVCGVLLRDLAPLLPIFCMLAWRWLYQRGLAPVTGIKPALKSTTAATEQT